jgi:hypothetical protein
LCAPLPGMDTRHIWCLKPESLEAAIYKLDPDFKLVAEFELPRDGLRKVPIGLIVSVTAKALWCSYGATLILLLAPL